MANNGSFTSSSYGNCCLKFAWEVNARDIENNKTTIYWQLRGVKNDTKYYVSGNFKIKIDNNEVFYSSNRINLYNDTLIAEGKTVLTHDDYGNKSFNVKIEAGIYAIAVNVSGEANFDLPIIERYAKFKEFYISARTINSISYAWNTDVACDDNQYSLNGGAWQSGAWPYCTISGLKPNTQYSLKIRSKRTDNQLWSESNTINVITYDIAKITSVPNFNDENNPTISYNNPSGNLLTKLEACISLNGNKDDIAYREISRTGNSYTFNLTEAERNVLRNATPNSNSLNVIFFVKTTMGNSEYYSTVNKTMSIVNANPVFNASQLTYLDDNSNCVKITGNNQHIVRNISNLKVTYTGAISKKGANISKYQITFNGGTQEKTSATTINYGIINSSQNLTVTVKAIDSRGNSTLISKEITILDWILPIATLIYKRVSNYEDNTTLRVEASISSVNSKNAIQSITYKYKKTSENSYSNEISINNNTNYSETFDKLYDWNIQFIIKDKFGTTIYNVVLIKGIPILFIDTKMLSIGFNKFPVNANSVDIDILNGKEILDYEIIDEW